MSSTKTLEEFYETLSKLPQSSTIPKEIIQALIKSTKNKDSSTISLKLINQIFRITAPQKILSKNITKFFFKNLFTLQKADLLVILDTMITYKTILILNKTEFFSFLGVVLNMKNVSKNVNFKDNKLVIEEDNVVKYLVELLSIFIDENSEDKNEFFDFFLENIDNKIFYKAISRKCFVENINNIKDEKIFVSVYLKMCEDIKEMLSLRYIKSSGAKKRYLSDLFKKYDLSFEKSNSKSDCVEVENVLNNNVKKIKLPNLNPKFSIECEKYRKLYEIYGYDNVAKSFFIENRKCCSDCIKIIDNLASDNSWRIRMKIMEFYNFEKERILDSSSEVRHVIFERIINEKMNDKETLLMLFKGCLTNYKKDYIDILLKMNIKFDFLYENRNEPGIKQFLKHEKSNSAYKINYYDLDDSKKKRFAFKYFDSVYLLKKEIEELLNEDLYSGFIYLKTKKINNEEYNEILDKNVKNVPNINKYKNIIYYLSEYIKTKKQFKICYLKCEFDFYYYSVFDSVNDSDLEKIMEKEELQSEHYFYYFISKFAKNNAKIYEKIKGYLNVLKDDVKIIEIISRSKNENLLTEFVPEIIQMNKNKSIFCVLNENVNPVSIIIYFLFEGEMQKFNCHFIYKAIYILCNGLKEKETMTWFKRVKEIIVKYLRNLSIEDKTKMLAFTSKAKLHSISKETKNYKIEGSTIIKESLPKIDIILYTVCDLIIYELKNCIMKHEEKKDFDFNCSNYISVDPYYAEKIYNTSFYN